MANLEKNLKKRLPSRIVGELGTYTTCIGKILNNPHHGVNSEVDREGALEPTRPPFSQLHFQKSQVRKIKIDVVDTDLKMPLKNFFQRARLSNRGRSPSKGTFSE